MFSQFSNHLPRSRPISKYGEEDFRESHRFGRRKAKNNVQRRSNSKTLSVSSSRNEGGKINELQEVYGAADIDMPMMEAITHNKKGVPSSVNGTRQSGEKQEIRGAVVDI